VLRKLYYQNALKVTPALSHNGSRTEWLLSRQRRRRFHRLPSRGSARRPWTHGPGRRQSGRRETRESRARRRRRVPRGRPRRPGRRRAGGPRRRLRPPSGGDSIGAAIGRRSGHVEPRQHHGHAEPARRGARRQGSSGWSMPGPRRATATPPRCPSTRTCP
jgi:hypothetical protein